MAHINIVLQFYPSRAVQLDLFKRLPHDIVWLMFRLLRRLDHGRLVEIALVVDVEFAEGILQPKDFSLLELGIFPSRIVVLATVEAPGKTWSESHGTPGAGNNRDANTIAWRGFRRLTSGF
jgi:hypothetical protein